MAPSFSSDQLVAYMESPDFNKVLGMFVESRDEFDLWFKERLANATGVDLNNPPEMQLPQLLSTYEARASRGQEPQSGTRSRCCTDGSPVMSSSHMRPPLSEP